MNKIEPQVLINNLNAVVMTGNETRIYSRGEPDFNKVVELYLANDFDGIEDFVLNVKHKIEKLYVGFKVENDQVFIEDECVPNYLGKRLLALADEGKDYVYVLNFWDRVKYNPSWRSVNCLFEFLENNHAQFHSDKSGRFVLWKAVTSEFKDKYTNKIDNSPGEIVGMDRNKVEDDPDRACGPGLHAGSHLYARGYATGSDKLIEVLVDPVDVVSVPRDSNWGKMRTCQYEVLKEIPRDSEFPTNQVYGDEDNQDFDDLDLDDDKDDEFRYCETCGDTLDDSEIDICSYCAGEEDDVCATCGNYQY